MNIQFLDVLYNLAFFCTFMYTVVCFVLSIKKTHTKYVYVVGVTSHITSRVELAQRSSAFLSLGYRGRSQFTELDIYFICLILFSVDRYYGKLTD